MKVKITFFNGELNEEIYMDQQVIFVIKGQEHKICKFQRSIYGLKQSSKQRYLRFHQAISNNEFMMTNKSHCVYTKWSKESFIIISLYVDDMLLVRNSKELIIATEN